jgi:hypothetical protein
MVCDVNYAGSHILCFTSHTFLVPLIGTLDSNDELRTKSPHRRFSRVPYRLKYVREFIQWAITLSVRKAVSYSQDPLLVFGASAL